MSTQYEIIAPMYFNTDGVIPVGTIVERYPDHKLTREDKERINAYMIREKKRRAIYCEWKGKIRYFVIGEHLKLVQNGKSIWKV